MSNAFKKQSKKAIKKDPHLTQKKIDEKIIFIKNDPYYMTQLIVRDRGKRKVTIETTKWRIIFCIVEECHNIGVERKNDCQDMSLDIIIIRGLMHRNRDYERGTN